MDDIKKIDPFQQMNADFDGVSINKWIELYTDYSCPKDTVFSLQKYYINNDNTLQLFVTDPNVFNDILYTKDNVLYANKCKMQLISTFYMARHIDKQFDATSIYIASNFIKYVNEKNLGVIGNDKGDYLLYTRHDENVLYILQHNDGKFTFVKLQDMLTINDNKKSNSSTDTLQSDNMMSTQNKNTDNDLPAFYNDVDVADTYPTMSIAYNNSSETPQQEINSLDTQINEAAITFTFNSILTPGMLTLFGGWTESISNLENLNLNKNIHKSLAPNYERWDARDYNLAAIENNAERISAEENYITGTLQETECQPDKQEVTINNLFKGM